MGIAAAALFYSAFAPGEGEERIHRPMDTFIVGQESAEMQGTKVHSVQHGFVVSHLRARKKARRWGTEDFLLLVSAAVRQRVSKLDLHHSRHDELAYTEGMASAGILCWARTGLMRSSCQR